MQENNQNLDISLSLEPFTVVNLPVHLLDDYTNWLWQRLKQNIGTHVVTLNAEMTMLSETNRELADVIKRAELIIPDGSGIILYLMLRGKRQRRCAGIELAASLLEEIGREKNSYPICFYGGKPGISDRAAQFWQEQIPGLSIISNHGYLSAEEEGEWCKIIEAKQPRLILVGLGVPRQEFWIKEHRELVPGAIWMGVGGSLDIWAGVKSRAPKLMQNLHLEWLYRLYQEPWRWRRMLALPQFAWRAITMNNEQ